MSYKSQKMEKIWSIHNILDSEVPNGAYFNVESVYLHGESSQKFDYAHHPKLGFSNCFFTWVCDNVSYMTTKNAEKNLDTEDGNI